MEEIERVRKLARRALNRIYARRGEIGPNQFPSIVLNQDGSSFLCVDRDGFYVINYRENSQAPSRGAATKAIKKRFNYNPRKDRYYTGGFFNRTEIAEMFPNLEEARILKHFNELLVKRG